MPAPKRFTQRELEAALPRLGKHYGHRRNVTGWDVGYVWSGGKRSETLALRIHVERKIDPVDLDSTEVFPARFEGFPLDVIQGPYVPSRSPRGHDPDDHFPVLVGGISCGRPREGYGTIGAIVIDERTGAPCILSNWHVLAGTQGRVSDPILQPGAADGQSRMSDVIAHLGNFILDRDGDAALAPLSGERPWMPSILGANVQPREPRDPKIGDVLTKCGRSTGRTQAMVDGVGSYVVDYGHARVTVDGFKLVPLTDPGAVAAISSRGDSGSLWFDPETGAGVGLHFAGETDPDTSAERALACRMTRVAARLGFRMAGLADVMPDNAMPEQRSGRSAPMDLPSPAARSRMSGAWPACMDSWPFPWVQSGSPVPWPAPGLSPGPWDGAIPNPLDLCAIAPNGRFDVMKDLFRRAPGSQGFERGSLGEVSLAGDIVPNLRLAMTNDRTLSRSTRQNAATVSMKAAISAIYPSPWGVPLAAAVNAWAPLGNRVAMVHADFAADGTFIQAALTIAERLEQRGYTVT